MLRSCSNFLTLIRLANVNGGIIVLVKTNPDAGTL